MGLLRGFHRLICLLAAWCVLMPLHGYAQQSTPAVTTPPATEAAPRQRRTAEKYYAQGVRATEKGDVEAAEIAFDKASKADPFNQQYAVDAQIAHQHGITKLVQDADKARLTGHPEVARAKLAQALALDPKNPEVSQHIDDLANLAAAGPPDDSVTATYAPAIELHPKPGKQSFHLKSTEQEVLRQVLTAYAIGMVADDSLGRQTIRFDADDVDYAVAAHMLNLVTNSFMVPLDPVRVLVAKETKDNHEKYDRLSLETIRLPGLTPTEFTDMGNLARNVLGVQQASVQSRARSRCAHPSPPWMRSIRPSSTCSTARAKSCST
jgi:tetratricopeptide (TPR) repeat protein